MDTLQLNVERNQFVGMLRTLSIPDKLEMYNVLKKSLLCDRMENLLNTIDAAELSMEDITEALEEVRKEK
jgi:hypothetical protein